MKKFSLVLLLLIFVLVSVTGCSSKPKEEAAKIEYTKAEDLKGKSVGTIVWFGVTDDVLLSMFSGAYKTEFKEVKSFESEAALIMALDTGKVDAAWLRDFQAGAYAKNIEKYSSFSGEADKMVAGSARMVAAVGSPAAEELGKINAALLELKEDGTLAQLQKEYIEEFDFTKNYESVQMPIIEGAPTYKVSISGSMVPLDYIAADGNPTGFSIALLAKIAEKANINFELVTVGFGTDRMELTSNKIDYIFCYTLTDDNMTKETEIIFSEPYFTYEGSAFLVKK
ncbi:MAG: transporter substrate-binding domain-containing protein [Eubacteriales bacterium]|nr:transporter substrate-binding domain-containing protein [Eubacteriales bacterium]